MAKIIPIPHTRIMRESTYTPFCTEGEWVVYLKRVDASLTALEHKANWSLKVQ
jgi:hypothetical protein